MKRVHTTKKSANRPFLGAPKTYGYNCYNTRSPFGRIDTSNTQGRIPRAAYKKATAKA